MFSAQKGPILHYQLFIFTITLLSHFYDTPYYSILYLMFSLQFAPLAICSLLTFYKHLMIFLIPADRFILLKVVINSSTAHYIYARCWKAKIIIKRKKTIRTRYGQSQENYLVFLHPKHGFLVVT